MDEKDLIQVNLRLPASALDSLTRLTEQLQRLAAAFQPAPEAPAALLEEHGENTAVDFTAYDSPGASEPLPSPPGAAVDAAASPAPAVPAAAGVTEDVPNPASAARTAETQLEDPAPAGSSPAETAAIETAPAPDFQELPDSPPAWNAAMSPLEDIPTAAPEPSAPIPTPQHAEASAETPAPEVPAIEETEWEPFPPLSSSERPVSAELPAPTSATFTPAEPLETPPNRRFVTTQIPTVRTPLPMTPETISQAFQRDSRRYDSGFPLY